MGWLEENLLPDHFCHLDLHSNTSESSAGELPVTRCCSLGLGHAQTRRGKNSSPHLLISPGGMQPSLGHTHRAVSRNNLLEIPLWRWGEGQAKEELMAWRELDEEGSMEIISLSIFFPENCASLALTSRKCPFKKGGPFSTANKLYDLGKFHPT